MRFLWIILLWADTRLGARAFYEIGSRGIVINDRGMLFFRNRIQRWEWRTSVG